MGIVAAGATAELSKKPVQQLPLDFLLEVMADQSHPIATRVDATNAAALCVYFRKIDTSGRDVRITLQIVRFSDMAGELEMRDRLAEPEPVTIEHNPSPATH